MRGHAGALLTAGLAAIALAFALLQAAVLARSARAHHIVAQPATHEEPQNRYSAPGGRSAIPWGPDFDAQQKATKPEGRSPESKPPEEHHSPPPPRNRLMPPYNGPRPARRAVA